jgi:hypothetical protein
VESFGIGPVRFSNEKLAAPFHSTKGPSSCFTFKQRTCSECKTVDAPSGGEAHPEQEPESLFSVLSNVTGYLEAHPEQEPEFLFSVLSNVTGYQEFS